MLGDAFFSVAQRGSQNPFCAREAPGVSLHPLGHWRPSPRLFGPSEGSPEEKLFNGPAAAPLQRAFISFSAAGSGGHGALLSQRCFQAHLSLFNAKPRASQHAERSAAPPQPREAVSTTLCRGLDQAGLVWMAARFFSSCCCPRRGQPSRNPPARSRFCILQQQLHWRQLSCSWLRGGTVLWRGLCCHGGVSSLPPPLPAGGGTAPRAVCMLCAPLAALLPVVTASLQERPPPAFPSLGFTRAGRSSRHLSWCPQLGFAAWVPGCGKTRVSRAGGWDVSVRWRFPGRGSRG